MGALQQDTAITRDGERLTALLDPAWNIWGPNGGYVASIALRAAGAVAPEGHRHPEGLAEAKDGLAFVATKANAVIIPTAISGAIGWNKKLFRFQRPKITVNFGRPFKFKAEGSRVPREALATMSHEAMYQLAIAVTDETKRGFYSDLSKATTEYLEFVKV